MRIVFEYADRDWENDVSEQCYLGYLAAEVDDLVGQPSQRVPRRKPRVITRKLARIVPDGRPALLVAS
jgi:hypothetical protein